MNKSMSRKMNAVNSVLMLTGMCFLTVGFLIFSVKAEANSSNYTDQLSNYIKTTYNTDNGLSSNETYCMLQTKDGYIWIGGYGGLLRYDGQAFRNFSVEDGGLPSYFIETLYEDSEGRLWIGTKDKGVFVYQDHKFISCRYTESQNTVFAQSFAEDSKGNIYAAAKDGIVCVTKELSFDHLLDEKIFGNGFVSISFDENDVLWAVGETGELLAFWEQEVVYFAEAGSLCPYKSTTVLADGNTVYVGTAKNMLVHISFLDNRYKESSFKFTVYQTDELTCINQITAADDNYIYIAAEQGTGRFDQNMKFSLMEYEKEPASFQSIITDYEGNIWSASKKSGVCKLSESRFFYLKEDSMIHQKKLNGTLFINGNLYAAADDGLHVFDMEWNTVDSQITERLQGVFVRQVYLDRSGLLWIATYGQGLLKYYIDTKEIATYTVENGLLSNNINQILQLRNGDFAVATDCGVNIIKDGEVKQEYGTKEGIITTEILSLCEMQDETLLLGSDGAGIYEIRNKTLLSADRDESIDIGMITCMVSDETLEGVWIAVDNALYFWDKEGLREIFSLNTGVGNILDIRLIQDEVVVLKSNGIFMASKDGLLGKDQLKPVFYGRENGLPGDISEYAQNQIVGSTLFICLERGMVLMDLKAEQSKGILPKTSISEVIVEDSEGEITTYPNPGRLQLSGNTSRVTINFSCLVYSMEPYTVSYKLDGFDKETRQYKNGEVNSVSYTNLKGGKYVFTLQAQNAQGENGEADTVLIIEKQPGIFEYRLTWWLLGGFFLLVFVIGIYVFYRVNTNSLKKKQEQYKLIAEQSLKTIANTIDARDKYTNGHSMRVGVYSREIARRLGMSEEEQENIYYIGLMHDIGKIGIPNEILNKPGKLSVQEVDVMRSHTLIGGEILKDFTSLPSIKEGALGHHEYYSGEGYPHRLSAEDIPLIARIINVADAYDAMSSRRAYREGQSTEYILAEFEKYSGVQFDPQIAQIMCEIIKNEFNPEIE